MKNLQKPIKSVALLVRPHSPQLKDKVIEILEIFSKNGIEVVVESENGKILGLPKEYRLEGIEKILGVKSISECAKKSNAKATKSTATKSAQKSPVSAQRFAPKIDALVSIGGDGTLISAVHKSAGSGLPIFGINMGHLGFLTAINPSELEGFANDLARGKYVLEKHRLLEGQIRDSKGKVSSPFYALNEILITKKDISGMIHIDAMIEGEFCNSYRADGLIIATPTGSSAYNISAGGSVVHPQCQVLLLTPVCAHSLTQRPMVISDKWGLEFRIHSTHISPSKDSAKLVKSLNAGDIHDIEGMIMIDGQQCASFKKGEVLEVKASTQIELIQHPKRSYFAVLREKFGLGARI
ncbi:NAD(+)/NADH kinase [Helicobacter sp. T3_23-1056]